MKRLITDPEVYRRATAHHEAGHAVLSVVFGLRFRYVTLRPRDRSRAGHVLSEGLSFWWNWHAEAAVLFGGVIAEDLWWIRCGPVTFDGDRRAVLTQKAGREDMRHARDLLREALERDDWRTASSLAVVPPPWTVQRMATQAWEHAVRTLLAYDQAVCDMADLLLAQRRAVTWAQAQEIVTSCKPRAVREAVVDRFADSWFLDHSRLRWQPRGGSCTPVFVEPVVARKADD
jgi:hypothetical protein